MTALMVATLGGHINELTALRDRIVGLDDVVWITNDHPQTRRMLEGEQVQYVPLIESRDAWGVAKAVPSAFRTIADDRFDRVISTGSALALAYLLVAALRRVPAHYLESSTRVERPSVTGSMLARVPGVTTWWPHANPPSGWRRFDGQFAHYSSESVVAGPISSAVVTVGTTDYCFRRLIERLVKVLPSDIDVFWQVGATDTTGLDIDSVTTIDSGDLRRRLQSADVVITHAGAGSLLQCLEAGKVPVFVPRREHNGEQIDDHQLELAEWAGQAGLAITADACEITLAHLHDSVGRRAVSSIPSTIDLNAR